MRNSRVTPASSAAAITAGSGRGQTTMMSRTPATRAGTAVISSERGAENVRRVRSSRRGRAARRAARRRRPARSTVEVPRHLARGDAARCCAPRCAMRAPHIGRHRRGGRCSHLRPRHFEGRARRRRIDARIRRAPRRLRHARDRRSRARAARTRGRPPRRAPAAAMARRLVPSMILNSPLPLLLRLPALAHLVRSLDLPAQPVPGERPSITARSCSADIRRSPRRAPP